MDNSFIEVKLGRDGRYTWKINVVDHGSIEETVKTVKQYDTKLRDEFPDFVKKAWGKVVELED